MYPPSLTERLLQVLSLSPSASPVRASQNKFIKRDRLFYLKWRHFCWFSFHLKVFLPDERVNLTFFYFYFFYKWAEVNFSISLATGFWLATPSFLSPGIHVFKISQYSSKNGAWHFCELATWTPSKWKVKTNIFFPSSFPTKTVDWNP